jgi:anthranilate phosphoribosyltransferase
MQPTGQVLGVPTANLVTTIAHALNQLGTQRAIVLYGREKLDEAGLANLTDLAILENGKVTESILDPQDSGLVIAPTSALKGGEAEENAAILRDVLQGRGTQAQQDAVALNASLALLVGEKVPNTVVGVTMAKDILASGAAWTKLEQLVKFLQAT